MLPTEARNDRIYSGDNDILEEACANISFEPNEAASVLRIIDEGKNLTPTIVSYMFARTVPDAQTLLNRLTQRFPKRERQFPSESDMSSDLGDRDAIIDLDEICNAINPTIPTIAPRIHIWSDTAPFRLATFDNGPMLELGPSSPVLELLGESHEHYFERLRLQEQREGKLSLILRQIEGSDPLKPVPLGLAKLSTLRSIPTAGIDSTIATIDQFDDILSIISGDIHRLNDATDFQASRTDLHVLNPRLVRAEVPGKVRVLHSRSDAMKEMSKAMRELEYNLAARYGAGSLLIMDGTLFGQDKHLSERLVEKGIIFCAVVKNPVSKIMQSWYKDAFTEYGYEEAAGDAIAYNDLLKPGTRSPMIFAEMLSWTSKIFTYYKSPVPGTTALRIEIPAEYAYMCEKIIDVVHCACSVTGDLYNNTALPIVHAEYVAKAMLPDPYQVAEYLRSNLVGEAQTARLQGSFNERRGFPCAN